VNVTKQDVVAAMPGEWQQPAGAASQAAQVFAVAENFKMKACLSSRIADLAQCLFAWQQLAGFKGILYRRLQVGQMLIDGKEHYVAIRPGTDFGFMAHHHAAGAIQTEACDGRVRLRHEFTGAAITKWMTLPLAMARTVLASPLPLSSTWMPPCHSKRVLNG
jgi:hypothetical protein